MRWLALLLALVAAPAQAERIRDLGSFDSVRPNQLVGYGIVVGLNGTGDDALDYATLAMRGVAGRMGLTLPPGTNPALKNTAAVMLTAELPAFGRPGQRIDITVSALGRARSIRGGTLIMSPLTGADGQIYAMAQGNVAVGGLGVDAADGSRLSVNIPTAGRIAGGATIERTVANDFASRPALLFTLSQPDMTMAVAVASAINAAIGPGTARALDAVGVEITAPTGATERVALMSRIEQLDVAVAEPPARVIVNARTGTVVISGAVRIRAAAVSHGTLTVEVEENPTIVQPEPFSQGETAEQRDSRITSEERGNPMAVVEGASLSAIVDAINRLGASPGDLVAILEALRQAGALRAELVII
jgi:flagellar P-ring protein FlgI